MKGQLKVHFVLPVDEIPMLADFVSVVSCNFIVSFRWLKKGVTKRRPLAQ
jgi:hypothetical protein